jgi:hypothetical protein
MRIQDISRGCPSPQKWARHQLNECSNFLSTQREDITYLFDSESNIEIITFYDTMPAQALENVSIRKMFHKRDIAGTESCVGSLFSQNNQSEQ